MRTVFVVDNDKYLVGEMAKAIRVLVGGVEVREFTDPILALGAAVKFKPDVVVVDLLMTAMDGVQFVREMRREGIDSETVMVAECKPDAMSKLLPSNGVDTIVSRPVPGHELADKVRKALGKGAPVVGA